MEENIEWHPVRVTASKQYQPEILFRYHELSKKLNAQKNNDKTTGNISLIQEAEIELTVFTNGKEGDEQEMLNVMENYNLDEEGMLHYSNLRYIVYQYVKHDYGMFFIKKDEGDSSDAEAHKENMLWIETAYDYIKGLRNLLLMREGDLNKVGIVFDLYDSDNKKQKDFQVSVWEQYEKKALINKKIENTLHMLYSDINPYIPSHLFWGKTVDNIDSGFVSEIFESRIRELWEVEGKKSSAKRIFKGVILKTVRTYIKNEDFKIDGKQIDDRVEKLLTYELLAMFELIELDLINKHLTRDSRIKYIDSLPYGEDVDYSVDLN